MRPLASDSSARGVRRSPVGRSRRARSASSAYVDTKTSKAASDPIRLSQSNKWHRISPGRRTATRGAVAELFCGAPASASQAVGSWHKVGVPFVGAAGCVPFVGAPVADDRSAHSAASRSRDRMPRVQALSHAREGCRPHFFGRGQLPALPFRTRRQFWESMELALDILGFCPTRSATAHRRAANAPNSIYEVPSRPVRAAAAGQPF